MSSPVEVFEAHRRRLFGLAYRMLGSATAAEDVVQEAYLRWHAAEPGAVRSPGGWLVRVVTNLCLNELTSARATRERSVGPWLPEPVLTGDGTLGPVDTAEQRESVSLALLVLLEALSPPERAVFVLREAFGYRHREVAELLGYSEANVRQVYGRARRRVVAARGRGAGPPADAGVLLERFLAAARHGDLAGLEAVLAADVESWADGGGRAGMARRPVFGRAAVARYVAGTSAKFGGPVSLRVAELNGVPGLLAFLDPAVVRAASPDRLPWLSAAAPSVSADSADRAGSVDSAVLVAAVVPEYTLVRDVEIVAGPAGGPGGTGRGSLAETAGAAGGGRIAALRIVGDPDKLAFTARQLAGLSHRRCSTGS